MFGTTRPGKRWGLFVTLSPCHLVTLSLLTAGCDFPGKPERPAPEEPAQRFQALFRQNCSGCHGADGKMGAAPPLNDPVFQAVVTEAELRQVIRAGRSVAPGQKTPMPAFAHEHGGPLPEEQITVLVEGIRQRWGPGQLPAGARAPELPSREKGNEEAGRKVFSRACAGCHGEQGRGTQTIGPIHEPAFLALISDRALRRYAITGRPDFGMPNYAGSDGRGPEFKPLTDAEIADLVALLAYWRQGGPANGK